MADVQHVQRLRRRGADRLLDLRRLDGAPEKHVHFEKAAFRADEEIARLPREHDRLVRGVDPLPAELGGRLPQPFPGLAQVVVEVGGERGLGCRPAVVRLAGLDPLLAVITGMTVHD